jgi:two-component system, chemotaxis family, protein-glutamate methylesterase/glutaminase
LSPTNQPRHHDILLLGGSSGSLGPLRTILSALPVDYPASVFVAVHLAASQREPQAALAQHSALPVHLAEDGARFKPGEVYMAPSDRHLALEQGVMRVFRGARENAARPAIDVLFRSAAVEYGARVVGVLLSGFLHDGSLGLAAVRRCGGVSIVQSPDDASQAEMPRRALAASAVDHCVPASQIAPLLLGLVERPAPESPPVPDELRIEARLALSAADPTSPVIAVGEPLPIVCPECSGPLSLITHGANANGYRCHVGHAYSQASLLAEHALALERALWVAFRTLKERGILLERMIEDARARGRAAITLDLERRRSELEQHARAVHQAMSVTSQVPADEQAGEE